MEKRCKACGKQRPLVDFIRRAESKDGYRARCKFCNRKQQKEYYALNKSTRKKSVAINVKRYRKKLAVEINALKAHPCMDCGKTYPPYVMDYDHRDPTTKVDHVSVLVGQRNFSKQRILDEIEKCDLVCANCHRERTHKRRQV